MALKEGKTWPVPGHIVSAASRLPRIAYGPWAEVEQGEVYFTVNFLIILLSQTVKGRLSYQNIL